MKAKKRIVSGFTAAALSLGGMAAPAGSAISAFFQNSIIKADAAGNSVADRTYETFYKAVSDIAAGKRDSTVVTISAEDLGLSDQLFTAEELGVESIMSGRYITDEAADVLCDMVYGSFWSSIDKLIYECPYEMFWYDITGEIVSDPAMQYHAKYDESVGEYVIGVEGYATVSLPVSVDYAADDNYTVDHDKIMRANDAVKNAKKIVAKYANASDMEKLEGYRKEICDLVSYDYDAVAQDIQYGDPWQMINVFDLDESTNVVCEGYAKAFKYLCDNTEFSSNRISCILAGGYMADRTGSDAHMWNVVRLPDGNNYLVDVTNCDSGSIGADDKLFLKVFTSGNMDEGFLFNLGRSYAIYVYDEQTLSYFGSPRLDLTIHEPEPSGPVEIDYIPGNGAAKLTWNKIEGAQMYGVCGYVNGKWKLISKGPATASSYVLNNLKAGTSYKVAVIAMFNGEWDMDFSKAITVTLKAAASKYPEVKYQVKGSQFRIGWTAAENAEGYAIAQYKDGKWRMLKAVDAKTFVYTSASLPAGTYNIAVAAKINGKWDVTDIKSRGVSITIK